MNHIDDFLLAWIRNAGYKRYPFAALYAEDDANLEMHFTAHTGHFEEYVGPSSAVIVGARGSGKTANCIKLAEALRNGRQSANLVIVYDDFAPVRKLSPSCPHIKHHLWQILLRGIQALLSTVENELPREIERDLSEIRRRCEHFHPCAPYWHWLDLWRGAVLSTRYNAIYVLIDERDSAHRAPAESPSLFLPLLDGDLFSLDRVHTKLFVPDDLDERVSELVAQLDEAINISRICWTAAELNLLLQNLLSRARVPAEEEPFGRWLPVCRELERITEFPFSSEIDREFVQKVVANDPVPRPRSLVRLGRILFDQCARNWRPGEPARIKFEDWAIALNRWLDNLNVKGDSIVLERIRLRFTNYEANQRGASARILVEENPDDLIRLPYPPAELWAVIWALERYAFNDLAIPDDLPYLNALERLKFLQESAQQPSLVSNVVEQIGTQLYDCLTVSKYFVQAVQQKLERVQQLRDHGTDARVWLEFRFDPPAMDVALYPWELLRHQGVFLLQTGIYELTRYIHLTEKEPTLELTRPFTLLYTAPRPVHNGLAFDLPCIEDAFKQFGIRYQLSKPEPPTFSNVKRVAQSANCQAWHYDGHGTFRRRCLECKKCVPPWPETCAKGHTTEGPFGYLQFEDVRGRSDQRKADDVLRALYESRVQLAVVNGCKTAAQTAAPAFGGIAPALIRARIPAVVSMLLSIAAPAATLFIQGFYQTLAAALEGGSLSGPAAARVLIQAVSEGRRRLLDATDDHKDVERIIHRQWFIPVLNLRYDTGGKT